VRKRGYGYLLAGAAACVAGFFALLVLAYYVRPTAWLDEAALNGFTALQRPGIEDIAYTVAHLFDPFPYGLFVVAAVAAALRFGGLRRAGAVGVLLVGANVSSQLLKPLLAYHRPLWEQWHIQNIVDAAYPSGHATAAMALALAVLMIVPRSFRPLAAALGALLAVALSFSILVLQWHFPSDIVGGYLIATAWCMAALAGLRFADSRWPVKGSMRKAARAALPAPSTASIVGVGVVTALVLGAIALATRADQIVGFAQRHTAFVAVATAIALAALALLGAVTRASHRADRNR
jgi:membrane-associated phospholipid phosphatase